MKKILNSLFISYLLSVTVWGRAPALSSAPSKSVAKIGVYIFDQDKKWANIVRSQPELILDHMGKFGYEVYGPAGLEEWLKQSNIPYTLVYHYLKEEQNKGTDNLGGYPSYAEWSEELRKLATDNPHILQLSSIGLTEQGREILAVKISDNPQSDENEPEFKYIANMHGDEIVGRELMLRTIRDMVSAYNNHDPEISNLIDKTEIFIIPSMNPDGAELRRRANSNFVDLNRNFPDFTTGDNRDEILQRAKETAAVMRFQKSRNFALSANFHGGAEVVNYPWDTTPDLFPFDQMIKEISQEYAARVPGMYDSSEFPRGVTNGHAWYEVDGGMQDWSYFWHQDLQVTIELSNTKWPSFDSVSNFYNNNKVSIIEFIKKIHQGGGIKYTDGRDGEVKILSGNKDLGTYYLRHGEFYKVLPPGDYTFVINSRGVENRVAIKVPTSFEALNNPQLQSYIVLND